MPIEATNAGGGLRSGTKKHLSPAQIRAQGRNLSASLNVPQPQPQPQPAVPQPTVPQPTVPQSTVPQPQPRPQPQIPEPTVLSAACSPTGDSGHGHLILEATVQNKSCRIPVSVLPDSGATGYAFMSFSLANQLGGAKTLQDPVRLTTFDGSDASSGPVTQVITASLDISGHVEETTFFVTNLGHQEEYQIVLGVPWLQCHDPVVDWKARTMKFSCHVLTSEQPVVAPLVQGFALCPPSSPPPPSSTPPALEINLIGAAPFVRHACKDADVFTARYSDVCKALASAELKLCASAADVAKALEPKAPPPDPKTLLPSEFHDFLDVFSRQAANALPPHRSHDHRIELQPGKEPGYGPLYSMSRDELKVLKKYLDDHLDKGFIRPSNSPYSSPVLFARKPSGGLRLCVDYRGLNAITIKNRYPLPLIQETLQSISKAKYFTKLDVVAAFNKLRMADGDEKLTAFRTSFGLFEYLVMPFGLCNAPSSFQRYINDTLHGFLLDFVSAYIDDILIYSKTRREHEIHVRQVLEKLRGAGLQIDIEKCAFFQRSVKYLGLIITTDGIRMDPEKLSAVADWAIPRSLREVQAFLGFANFYRRFIPRFSAIAAPLTNLTKKGIAFNWSPSCQAAFADLKQRFVSGPVLKHFDFDLPCRIETDASDYVSGGVLMQPDNEGQWRPVAYFSSKMSPAECNYEIYDKELLAIIRALETWRPELESTDTPVEVVSDHRNLEYFMSSKRLSRRQARWSEFLSRFNFEIVYRPGSENGCADALTRRSQDFPRGEDDDRVAHQTQTVLKPHQLHQLAPVSTRSRTTPADHTADTPDPPADTPDPPADTPDPDTPTLPDLLIEAYQEDPFVQQLLTALENNLRRLPGFPLSECTIDDDGIGASRAVRYRQTRLWVPDFADLHRKLCQAAHDGPSFGHPGAAKTFELLSREYWWPGMLITVKQFCRNCEVCRRSKPSTEQYHGALKTLPVADRRWRHLSMDFVVGLPPSMVNGQLCENILVFVDRLTKMTHVIPCSDMSADATAALFYQHIWRLHGLPDTIVSDRGTQFTSQFWSHLCHRLKIKSLLSTAFHPESDGQTERMNALVEQYLRCYCTYLQDDWAPLCASAEFALNNHSSEATHVTPFFANLGQHPRTGIEPQARIEPAGDARAAAETSRVDQFAADLEQLSSFCKTQIQYAKARYEATADTHRQHAPLYVPGDHVWLDTRNIKTRRPSKKLDHKSAGPLRVRRRISPQAYQLELPEGWRIHDTFHVSLLRPVASDPLPGQLQVPPPPVITAETPEEEEYEVEYVADSRLFRKSLQYLVKWVGYEHPTWQPLECLENSADAVRAFHERHPDKPRQPRRRR